MKAPRHTSLPLAPLLRAYVDAGPPPPDCLEELPGLGARIRAVRAARTDWLTDAFYTLGDQDMLVHDLSGAKRAWQHYVDRHPKDQTRYTTAYNALATTLKSVP